MTARRATLGTAAFVVLGPGLEAGAGPYLVARLGDATTPWPLVLRVAGAALIAAGLAVLVALLARFATEGAGTPSPSAPTQRLIVTGPYRRVRHPMYLATAAVIAGEGLLVARPTLVGCAVLYVAATATLAHVREERLLERRFGAPYAAYRAAVPAWRPLLRPWRP